MKAKLLDEKLSEAGRVLEHLRNIALPMAQSVFDLLARSGRWSTGQTRAKRFALVAKIECQLTGMGVSITDIDQAKEDLHRFTAMDIAHSIVRHVYGVAQQNLGALQREIDAIPYDERETGDRYSGLQQQILLMQTEFNKIDDSMLERTPERILAKTEEMLHTTQCFSETQRKQLADHLRDEIDDLRYFARTRSIRRPEVWFASIDEHE